MVTRVDAQMVTRLVAQSVMVVCVESHKYGGATVKQSKGLVNDAAAFLVFSR